jgi:hypothetical protein
MVEVHYDEGVARHIGPEPCAGIREDAGEASVAEHAGQPLGRERMISRAPTLSTEQKATRAGVQSRVRAVDWSDLQRPEHFRTELLPVAA